VPDELLAVAVWVGQAGASGAPLDQVHERSEGTSAAATRALRDGEQVATRARPPWEQEDPGHWDRRHPLPGGSCSRQARGRQRRRRDPPRPPVGVDASSRLEAEPGIKDPEKVRAYVEAARA
jgi:hypothetical protein